MSRHTAIFPKCTLFLDLNTGAYMDKLVSVKSWKYDAHTRHLKIFYENGTGELYHPVPLFVYDNLLRAHDKAAFVHKYIEFDLHFNRVSIL